MTEKVNPDVVLLQLETQLLELVGMRDWLNERIRLIRESIERLRKQAQVNQQLELSPPSKAFLQLLADLTASKTSVDQTTKPIVTLEDEVVSRQPKPLSRKPRSYGVISLLQQVLETLVRDTVPESVSEALATAFGDTWTEKSFSLFKGRSGRVTINTYSRGEVPEEFRRYLTEAFLKLRATQLNQVPEGFLASDKLIRLAQRTATDWDKLEKTVVEKWLPKELAHLRKS